MQKIEVKIANRNGLPILATCPNVRERGSKYQRIKNSICYDFLVKLIKLIPRKTKNNS